MGGRNSTPISLTENVVNSPLCLTTRDAAEGSSLRKQDGEQRFDKLICKDKLGNKARPDEP